MKVGGSGSDSKKPETKEDLKISESTASNLFEKLDAFKKAWKDEQNIREKLFAGIASIDEDKSNTLLDFFGED